MKLLFIQILLICFESFLCNIMCASIEFDPLLIFDTQKQYGKQQPITYTVHDAPAYCYISFYSDVMPEYLTVDKISDCSSNFRGNVKAGVLKVPVPQTLQNKRCYFQHNWIICVCNFAFCNSPQYWPLMLSRFLHNQPATTRTSEGFADAEIIIKSLSLPVKINKKKISFINNLRCLVLLSDTVFQEEENPQFYLFNYITTRYRAPPLADVLSIPPVVRQKTDWKTKEDYSYSKLVVNDKEPFKDGTHEADDDYRRYPFEVKQDDDNFLTCKIVAIASAISLVLFLTGTILFLCMFCNRLRNHSLFPRVNAKTTWRRYYRLHTPNAIPDEFMLVQKKTLRRIKKVESGLIAK